MSIALLLLVAVAWLAWNNGANDNFIGVATLYGSRTCTYRTLVWATLATGAGTLVSVSFAHLLVARFSGAGLLDEQTVGTPLLASVATAAALTKWLATRLGIPASTTHALTGEEQRQRKAAQQRDEPPHYRPIRARASRRPWSLPHWCWPPVGWACRSRPRKYHAARSSGSASSTSGGIGARSRRSARPGWPRCHSGSCWAPA